MVEKLVARPRLHTILEQRGITEKELVLMTGISPTSISRFDRSSRYDITHLIRIAAALNIPINELFDITTKE